MAERSARRKVSFLLATTFAIGTGPAVIGAMAKDETPSAASDAKAQAIQLDTITVESKPRVRRRPAPAVAPAAPPPAAAPLVTTNAGGDIGYHANSTSTATKTNTPLRDIPQAITVITKQQVQDIGAQRIEDVVRYVPGVNWHQGEGNRDQLVIRGQSSTADFFVNGMRDDGASLSRPLQHRAARIPQGPERDDLRPRRRRWRAQPRAQGSRWRSDQRVEGADRVLQQRPRVRATSAARSPTTCTGASTACTRTPTAIATIGIMQRGGVNPTLTWLATPLTKVKLSATSISMTSERPIAAFPRSTASRMRARPANQLFRQSDSEHRRLRRRTSPWRWSSTTSTTA